MKRIVALLLAAGLLAAIAGAVYATSATVIVTGGSLSVTPADVSLSGVTLDGTDKTSTSAYTSNAWTAEDARGTGVGWNVTIEATDFSDGSHTIDISQADQKFQIQEANISVIAGNTAPTSSVATLTDIPTAGGTPLKIVSAAVDAGMGEYNIPPNFSLMVPAETYAGSYTSTVTIAINSAP
jgi:hypothetical protein